MTPTGKRELRDLIDKLRIVSGAEDENLLIDEVLRAPGSTIVSFLNQHGLNLAIGDIRFRQSLLGVNVLLRDGVGMEFALRLLKRNAGHNTNGTDFIPKVLERARGHRVALFGTVDPWLSAARQEIVGFGVDVVATLDGFQEEHRYVELVRMTNPDIVVLAMGMPRQEYMAEFLRSGTSRSMLILNGGAILDFLGKRFPRAPRWIRVARMEWAFRLAQEPHRLGPRYLDGGFTFLLHMLQLRSVFREN